MAVYEKNGMLQRAEQMEIKTREQKILASGMTDNQKAAEIDLLYRQRGLEPGSFYRADFDQTTSSGSSDHCESDGDSWSGRSCLILVAVLAFVILGPTLFPKTDQFVMGILLKILMGVGDAISFIIEHL